jgi:alkylation response protein AidB-like acyl-CoA dehydrogenase
MESIVRAAMGRPRLVIAVWLIVAAICVPLMLDLPNALKAGGFENPRGEDAKGQQSLEHHFDEARESLQVVLHDPAGDVTNVIGEANDGWRGALTTLSYERAAIGSIFTARSTGPPVGRTATEAAEEAAAYLKTYEWYPSRMGRADLLVPHARAAGRAGDPVVRQRIAQVASLVRIDRWTHARAREARRAGRPGPEGSIGKLVTSRIAQAAARAHALIGGARGLLAGPDGPLDGTGTEVVLSSPAQSIAGGTDEIQKNIIAERVLGLPKEPQVDADVPFREIRRNTPRSL